jgi:hypothetical protein
MDLHKAVFRIINNKDGKPDNELLISEIENNIYNGIHEFWQRL